MTNRYLFAGYLFSVLLLSCSKDVTGVEDVEFRSITFYVSNYKQYSADSFTRTAEASDLDNLVFCVYSEDGTQVILPAVTKKSGEEGYGVFEMFVPYGTYRVVCLGYNGNRKCILDTPFNVCFEQGFVPETFLYSMPVVVEASSPASQPVVLKRVVSAFRLVMEDAIPKEVGKVMFSCDGGGVYLDAFTGHAASSGGRSYTFNIPASSVGVKGQGIVFYLYLPSDEMTMNFTVDALTTSGSLIQRKTFSSVPMRVNRITQYEGPFFSGESDVKMETSTQVMVDKEWEAPFVVAY